MKDKQISIRLPANLVAELDRLVEQRHGSRATMIASALRQHLEGNDDSQALVASMDGLSARMERIQADMTQKLAQGLAEIHDQMSRLEARFDEIEELQTHHLYNFLAYVAPDADELAAAERGRRRLVRMVHTLEEVRTGRLMSLLAKAREEDMAQNEPGAGQVGTG